MFWIIHKFESPASCVLRNFPEWILVTIKYWLLGFYWHGYDHDVVEHGRTSTIWRSFLKAHDRCWNRCQHVVVVATITMSTSEVLFVRQLLNIDIDIDVRSKTALNLVDPINLVYSNAPSRLKSWHCIYEISYAYHRGLRQAFRNAICEIARGSQDASKNWTRLFAVIHEPVDRQSW